jgi:general secretion pathway protein K
MKPAPCLAVSAMARNQGGAAVLVAMLVVAMAALAASSFMFRSQVEWRRMENFMRQDQAHWVLRAAEQWGAAVLRDDARRSSVDHPGEAWATQLPPVEAEGYRVSGRMEDQDGRFNLNNLVVGGKADAGQMLIFIRLLRNLNLPEALAATTADWMDEDDIPLNPESAETAYYAGRASANQAAYRAANRPLVSLNELLRVKGFDRNVLATLRPFVTLLPARTLVNVNTARPEVISALVEGMALTEAYALVAKRERAYYRNIQDFLQAMPTGLNVPNDLISVSSSYFLVQARIRHERLSIGSHALFHRAGSSPPTLVWRAEL